MGDGARLVEARTRMTTEAGWTRLKALFNGALDQPAGHREQWLRDAAAGDLELLHEAQALVEAHETAGDFLEQPIAVVPDDLATLAPGTRVGPYVIVEELGRGGMGVVYLAEDTRLGRRVALKALPAAAAADPAFRERLRREARAAATISHRAVAVVYALEEIDDQLFIASEYVPGRTLRSELAAGPIADDRARAIAAEIARALAAAHAAGVIHRDLKPENVLLTADGGVKVVDFGIAQVEGVDVPRLTREGAILGTPAYMAPEQLAGRPVDARADIYAAGVVLAEMVKGRTSLLTTVIERCVQADPSQRFASAGELLRALEGRVNQSRWWWEFHQGMAALTYWLMVIAAWRARGAIGGATGRVFFIVTLAAVIVAANLRLHLWFTSRLYPAELKWLRGRVRRWIHAADWVFCLALIAGALMLGDDQSPLAILLLSFGIGAAVAFLVIEPATTRASFRINRES
jgi:predicted Ser/Thr protein kinase